MFGGVGVWLSCSLSVCLSVLVLLLFFPPFLFLFSSSPVSFCLVMLVQPGCPLPLSSCSFLPLPLLFLPFSFFISGVISSHLIILCRRDTETNDTQCWWFWLKLLLLLSVAASSFLPPRLLIPIPCLVTSHLALTSRSSLVSPVGYTYSHES